MLVNGGNASPSADDVKAVLSSVGIEADEDRLNQLMTELSGKTEEELNALIEAGMEKLASVSVGGGAGGAVASDSSEAAVVEEEEEEEEEEMDLGGGMDMFGGEGGDY
jgi:ribosomal protein L12E/L44/L45/RPP1/RPP2